MQRFMRAEHHLTLVLPGLRNTPDATGSTTSPPYDVWRYTGYGEAKSTRSTAKYYRTFMYHPPPTTEQFHFYLYPQ
jgi:hypothetical protein